jgi:CBS domain containing-hemolysin-like protein
MGLQLLAALALVLANGFFVAAEFAIARLRPTQVDELIRERKPGARSAKHAVEHIDSYLGACQLGITLASLGLGAVGERAFHHLFADLFGASATVVGIGVASAIAFLTITVLHIVLGELAPKSAAISRTTTIALALAPPMRAFYLATRPLVDAFNGLGNLVLKPFGIPPASEAGHAPHSEDELRQLLRESRQGGMIGGPEQQLSDAALVFGDRRVREVMRPRAEIDFVLTSDDLRTAAEKALRSGHTRMPACERDGELESAPGVVNAKDLLRIALDGDGLRVADVLRPLSRVSESSRVDEVGRQMRRERRHIALVVDEHGTVTGLVTLEDILEELVGEIEDEFDTAEEAPVREEDGTLRIDGGAPVRVVADRLGVRIEAPHEATISGHLIEDLGHVPRPGDVVMLGDAELEVTAADETRISELRAPVRG